MNGISTLNLTNTHNLHHTPAQPGEDEEETRIVVTQYGKTWVALMLAGATVTAGNIIDTEGMK